MIKKVELKERGTNQTMYPITSWECILDFPQDGKSGQILFTDGLNVKWGDIDIQNILAYGVEWDITVADPRITRIGNATYHKTLPIQSELKGCIALGDLIIYWLDENNWKFRKEPIFYTVDLSTNHETFTIPKTTGLGIGLYVRGDSYIGKITAVGDTTITVDWGTTNAGEIANISNITSIEIGSRLDGYDGTVRVRCPEFWIKSEIDGNKRRVWISTIKIDDSWTHQPACLIDAYRSTILRSVPTNMGYLSTLPANSAISVVNTSDYCRGGNNNTTYDKYFTGADNTEIDIFRTQLGKPASNIGRPTMRTYARNAGCEMLTYNLYKNIFYWLYVIEYANFHSLDTFNSALTSEGYHQGGLGSGVTIMGSWDRYNGYFPLTPCGYCDEFGNNTGIKEMIIPEFLYTTQTFTFNLMRANSSIVTSTNDSTSKVITSVKGTNRDAFYCYAYELWGSITYVISGLTDGLKVIFKEGSTTLLEVSADGEYTVNYSPYNLNGTKYIYFSIIQENCNIRINSTNQNSELVTKGELSIKVPRWRGFDNPFGDIWTNLDGIIIERTNGLSNVYTTNNPSEFTDVIGNKMLVGKECLGEGYIKTFDLGDTAEIIPSNNGAGYGTYKCDYHYRDSSVSGLRALLVGGSAHHGGAAGLGFFDSHYGVAVSSAYVGFRSSSSSFSGSYYSSLAT